MRLVYLGSSQDSVYPLEYLIENSRDSGHEILAVVTQAPKVGGRGRQQNIESPLALFAKNNGIVCLQPEKASDPAFQSTLLSLAPDVMITCAYGQILNDNFLSIPKRATINIHPSLLPHYRGATPVQTALLDGLRETGVSILFTIKELDAGNIILQKRESIFPEENSGTLMARLFKLSGPLLLEALEKLKDTSFVGKAQDHSQVSLCKKIKKEDGLIIWNKDAKSILNQYRAYNPWPGCFTFFQKKRIIIEKLEIVKNLTKIGAPGFFSFSKEEGSLIVSCLDKQIKIKELKPEGSRVLMASEFWNGIKNREHLCFSNSSDGNL